MRMKLLVPMILASQLSGCCNAPEEYAVTVSAVDSLAITWADRTVNLQLGGRIADSDLAAAQFSHLYDALEGRGSGGDAVVISLFETDPATGELFSVTLAVPSDLRRGQRYTVGRAISVPPGDGFGVPGTWGRRSLSDPDRAEVAFSASIYTFPPAARTITFVATHAEGSIDVVERGTGWVHLVVALRLEDADGRSVSVAGRIQAQAERYTPPCT